MADEVGAASQPEPPRLGLHRGHSREAAPHITPRGGSVRVIQSRSYPTAGLAGHTITECDDTVTERSGEPFLTRKRASGGSPRTG